MYLQSLYKSPCLISALILSPTFTFLFLNEKILFSSFSHVKPKIYFISPTILVLSLNISFCGIFLNLFFKVQETLKNTSCHKHLDSVLQSLGLQLLSTVLYFNSWRVNKTLHCSKSNLKRHNRMEVLIRRAQFYLPAGNIRNKKHRKAEYLLFILFFQLSLA